MSSEAVEAIERELGMGNHESRFRAASGLWKQLQALRTQAVRNDRAIPRYKAALAKVIGKASAVLADHELDQACGSFLAFYRGLYQREDVIKCAGQREPPEVENWAHQHAPLAYRACTQALAAWMEQPTRANLETTMRAFMDMTTKYVTGQGEQVTYTQVGLYDEQ